MKAFGFRLAKEISFLKSWFALQQVYILKLDTEIKLFEFIEKLIFFCPTSIGLFFFPRCKYGKFGFISNWN